MEKKLTAFLLVIGFAVCIAAVFEIVPGLLSDMDVYQLTFWACLFIFLLLNIISLVGRVAAKDKSTGGILISLLASVFLFSGFLLYSMGAEILGSDTAFSLIFIAPLLILIFASFFIKENLTVAKMLAMIFAGIGAYCLFIAKGIAYPSSLNGLLLVLSAAVSWSIFSLLSIKTKAATYVNVYIYVAVSTVLATATLFVKSEFMLPKFESIGPVLLLGTVILLLVFLWTASLKSSSTSFWGTIVYAAPAIILLYEIVFRSGSVALLEIIGLSILSLTLIYRMSIKM